MADGVDARLVYDEKESIQMRKLISLILILVFCLTFVGSANAMDTTNNVATQISDVNEIIDTQIEPYALSKQETTLLSTPAKASGSIRVDTLQSSINAIPFDQKDAISPLTANRSTRSSVSTMAAQYNISANANYTHGLASGSDYNFYICPITKTGAASIYLNSSGMEFNLGVSVRDASFNTLYEEYSTVPSGWYGGQRIRVNVTAGQYVVLLVQANGPFVAGSTYDFGVQSNGLQGDAFEINDNLHQIGYVGDISTAEGVFTGASIDNGYDVDWYAFSFDGESGYYPGIKLMNTTTQNITAQIFTADAGGNLSLYSTFTSNSNIVRIPSTSATTYYMAVFSKTANAGSYYLSLQKSKINGSSGSGGINVWFENAQGDYGTKAFYDGTRKTARNTITGKVKLTDYSGQPVENETVAIVFASRALFSNIIHTQAFVTSDSQGYATFTLHLPTNFDAIWECTIGDYTYLYEKAVLYAQTRYDVEKGTEDWYWCTGSYYWK